MAEEKFTYAVGRPWKKDQPNGAICFYTWGCEIHHGTMEDAVNFQNYCNKKLALEDRNPELGQYQIYKITPLLAEG